MFEMRENEVAVLTGGSGGIGRAIAKLLLDKGSHVALIDIEKPDLECFGVDRKRVIAIAADVTDEDSLTAARQEVEASFGSANLLFANAGVGPSGGLLDTDPDAWKNTIDVNLSGSFNTLRIFVPLLRRASGRRSIVLTSSVLATRGARNMLAYSASKAGLVGVVQSAAQELAPEGITVNGLAPGPIWTPMLEKIAGDTLQALTNLVPLRRLGTPEDVARAAAFLCDEASSFITGQLLVIDGGLNGRAYWRDA